MKTAPLLFIVLVVITGCRMRTEPVRIESVPPGAVALVNGEAVGTTPLEVELETRRAHAVRIERAGFAPADARVIPVPNGRASRYIRFGLLDRVGYYESLSPNPLRVELTPVRLRPLPGEDALSSFAGRVREFDAYLEAGAISAAEHRRLIDRLLLLVP